MCDPKQKITYTDLFINNEWVSGQSGQKFKTVNPSTEEVLAEVYQAGREDVDKAVQAAKQAFEPSSQWRKMSSYDRGQLMRKLADLIEKNQDELANIEALDNGKAFITARDVDVAASVQVIRYYSGWCDKISGKTLSIPGPYFCYTRREPVGVCGQIIPWNFPIMMMVWKISPALATGCTVVLKPAEQTPLSALRIASLINEAGFPPGVVNVVTGDGLTGSYIVDHPDVSKISFTGSSEVGQIIMQRCSINNLKKITLELGGKSPIVVLDDANIDDAVDTAHSGVFFNSGQVCSSSSRIFVHEKVYDEFVKKSIAKAKSIKVGNPFESDTYNGPQIDETQFNKILGYMKKGVDEGAKLELGGKRLGNKGYFIEPTIFSNVTDQMTIAKEEIFGPSMQILKFSDINDAIKRANATEYGLAASVFTTNIEKYLKVVNEFQAGIIAVNGHDVGFAGVPFGGYKKSGFGKDLGQEGLEGYLQTKVVVVKQSEDTLGF